MRYAAVENPPLIRKQSRVSGLDQAAAAAAAMTQQDWGGPSV